MLKFKNNTFFKKPLVRTTSIIILAIVLSTITNAYYRDIQEKIHDGIGYIYDKNETIGQAVYDVNAFLLNGDGFDQERRAKDVIYDSFGKVVVLSVFAPDNPELNGMSGRGTGFIIDVDETSATIVTNHHVVDAYIDRPEMFKLNVQTAMDMWSYEATIVGYDQVTDIAVIKINKREDEEWEAIEWGTKDDYNTGTPVVVIGHGMSMSWTSTQGHVVYKDRFGMRPYNLMLQVDAVINQGNSGGPIFNDRGQVIGVAQSIYSPGRSIPGWDGVGMAVSVEQVRRSVDYIRSPQYNAKGYVPYVDFPFKLGSFLFEEIKDIPDEDRHYAYFDYSKKKADEKPTVGELAGFQQGDVLIEINGVEVINSFKVLRDTLTAFPGDIWKVTVRRGEDLITIDVAMRETDHTALIKAITSREKGRGGK
ncbi:S1C family serine protease [bacterium]|nr:S1C family serine protease [bacterium]